MSRLNTSWFLGGRRGKQVATRYCFISNPFEIESAHPFGGGKKKQQNESQPRNMPEPSSTSLEEQHHAQNPTQYPS